MTKQAPADKKAPNRSIFVTILRSMLAVLLVELVLLIGILYFSRVNVQLEQNAADLLQKQVENRQSYLQSLMLSAQDLSTLAGSINTTAQSLIDSGDISVDTLDRSNEDALPLLSAIGEKMIASMRRRFSSASSSSSINVPTAVSPATAGIRGTGPRSGPAPERIPAE